MADEPAERARSGPRLTRRGVLAAGAGLAATACGAARRDTASPAGLLRGPLPTPPAGGPRVAGPDRGVPAGVPGLTRVPVAAVPRRSQPAYYVHDVLPDAPANAVALTIDDGPDPLYTPEVLAVLAEHGIRASFSVIGR